MTRSLTQPPRDTHLIFHHDFPECRDCFFIFSPTYPQNTDKESVSSLGKSYQYLRGLILCWRECLPAAAIYNPTTRQSVSLPEMEPLRMGTCFLGYDPLENQYKVLCVQNYLEQCCLVVVFTLGYPTKEWRTIQCNVGHQLLLSPYSPAVCVNGVIYYIAMPIKEYVCPFVLMSFDVKSEKLNQVEAPDTLTEHYSTLINYQGKLGLVCCKKGVEIWVMEDDEKTQVWSRVIFYEMDIGFKEWHIVGATRGGEIVFVKWKLKCHEALYVFYYDPKQNSLRGVEVEGTTTTVEHEREHLLLIWAVPDHIENMMRL